MLAKRKKQLAIALCLLASFALSACSKFSFLSGSASMRVDVYVYKGPLANTEAIQKGQLSTLVKSASLAVQDIDNQLVASMCRIGCVQRNSEVTNTGVSDNFVDNIYARTPTVTQCHRLGIPQERYLDHNAWVGKTYKPAHVDAVYSSGNAGPEPTLENSVELYKSLPKSTEKCIEPKNGITTGKHHFCKGGLFGKFKRRVVRAEDIEAKPKQNAPVGVTDRDRYQAPYQRFPEYNRRAYQVCPAYVEMRTELSFLKAKAERIRSDKSSALAFSKIVNQGNIIQALDRFLSSTIDADQICKDHSKKDDCTQNIGTLLADYERTANALRKAIGSRRFYLDQTDTILDDPAQRSAMAGYLAHMESLQNAMFAATLEADETVEHIDRASKDLGNRQLTTALIEEAVKPMRAKLQRFHADAALNLSIATQYAAFKTTTISENNIPTIAAAVEKFTDAVKKQHDRMTTILEDKKKLDEYRKGPLAILLSTQEFQTPETNKTQSQARALEPRLRTLKKSVTEPSGLPAIMAQLQKRLQLKAAITEIDSRRNAATFKRIAEKKPSENSVLHNNLDELASQVSMAMSVASESEQKKLNPIETAISKARAVFEDLRTRDSWQDVNGKDFPETVELDDQISILKKAKGISVIVPSEDQSTAFATTRDHIAGVMDGTPNVSPTIKEAITTLATTYDSAASELGEFNKRLKPYSLDQTGGDALAALKKLKLDLLVQKADLSAIGAGVGNLLDLSTKFQAAHEDTSYREIAELAGHFRLVATSTSFEFAAVDPPRKRLRVDMAKMANMAAEFANQLTSRANALSLQANGLDRRVISTGQYLRDTQPTAYLEIYDWLESGVDRQSDTRDRIEVTKRLFDDDNWAKQPSVYASGSGKVSMAFIRDEIGNWNLKSFENDPSELTAAYARFGTKLITKAAAVATAGPAGAAIDSPKVAELLRFAADSSAGVTTSETKAGALIDSLNLEAIRKEHIAALDEISTTLATAIKAADEKKKEGEQTDDDLATIKESEKKTAILKARSDTTQVVSRYADLVKALQTVAAAKPNPDASMK